MNTPTPLLRGHFDEAVWASVHDGNEYALPQRMDGLCVMDIGACFGAFAVLAASRGAFVAAFEPCPENAQALRENVARFGLTARVLAVEAAVTERSGHARMVRSEDPAGRHLHPAGAVEVRAIGLDAACHLARAFAGGTCSVDLCKIDAEGSEYALVESPECDESLRLSIDELAVEFHGGYVTGAVRRATACRTRLAALGFEEVSWEATHAAQGWYRLYRGRKKKQ